MAARSPAFVAGDHGTLTLLVGALSGLAWFALWRWGQSPYLHAVHHAPARTASDVTHALVFLGGWTLMTVAMMLPTTVPLLGVFARVARARPDRSLLVALVALGYLGTWAAVGAWAYVLVVALRSVAASSNWFAAHAGALGAAALLLGGAYQFSALKYRCLDKCRSPFMFVMQYWTGTHYPRQAALLGLHHGLFCVGCCWALMLLMLPFGAANLGWMLALGAAMAIEKNVSWGHRLSRPLGALLLFLGVLVALRPDVLGR